MTDLTQLFLSLVKKRFSPEVFDRYSELVNDLDAPMSPEDHDRFVNQALQERHADAGSRDEHLDEMRFQTE